MNFADLPKNELEFHERFCTEEACRKYFSSIRWPGGFVCPHCGHNGGWRRTDREEMVCAGRTCGKETSLRSGTILHKSSKPLRMWLYAMFHVMVSKQGMSALRLMRILNFGSYRTAARWLGMLRIAMGVQLDKAELLSGDVEVDETYFGRPDEGRKAEHTETTQICIIGAVERVGAKTCGRARLRYITEVNTETIATFVKDKVAEGSQIYSDQKAAYEILALLGYELDSRKSSVTTEERRAYAEAKKFGEKVVHKSIAAMPCVHRVFSLIQRVILGTHQGSYSREHLQQYLDEYCYRFERRNKGNVYSIVNDLAHAAMGVKAIPYWRYSGRKAPDVRIKLPSSQWKIFGGMLGQLSA
jgi:hypothetical protein